MSKLIEVASDGELEPRDWPQNAPCFCKHPRADHEMAREGMLCMVDHCWCYHHGFRARPWWSESVEPLYLDPLPTVQRWLLKQATKRRDLHLESKSIVDDWEKQLSNEYIAVTVEWAICHMLGVPMTPVLRTFGKNKGDGHSHDVVLPKTGRLCEVKATAHGTHLLNHYGGLPPASIPPPWDVAVVGKWATKPGRVALLGYVTRQRYFRYRKVTTWKRPTWGVEQLALADLRELLEDEGIVVKPEWTWEHVHRRDQAELNALYD